MNVETIEDLFGYQLQHAYYAERTQVELLEELAADCDDRDLESSLREHREETREHVDRLEDVFAALGRQPRASRARTVDGLAEAHRNQGDGPEQEPAPSVLETALLAERFEIRTYETLVTLAGRLAYADDVVEPLEATLAEEREMRRTLEERDRIPSVADASSPEKA
ncbi:YciE/YciF family protein [Halobiforma lacisalsi AJ5]|uniref:YciE/YciF family protein n=1 Tax=Natronobacterium lacisalsi AJ5 TaxID=358396 RepID=M0LNE5_NATLA|nr:DUF892 family protein [Halobiforma lacisalsi]APW96928.1 YciE/YciF family protein [Halobiforma lacisalsi AJ5]EMA34638.1 hypothetical protein C445_06940 [Halobiforma lacisalsi AJ5]